jgi:DNA-binding ferritin-like protein
MEKELLSNVLQVHGQLKVLHWQTESYAEHNAFGNAYDALSEILDRLIEVYSGKYKRPKFGGVMELTFADYDTLKVDAFLNTAIESFVDMFMAEQDAELANIRDEIVAEIDKLKYFLTLK